jgi:hypothetical protein
MPTEISMKNKLFVRAIQLLPVFLIWCTLAHGQQLKLGNNPSTLQKSALLELESSNQGLLLPRISDTTTGPMTTAPDGMIIYLTTNKSLCIRSNGYWRPLLPVGYALTSLNGQTIAIQSLATTNAAGTFGFSSAAGTHTLNIPDATATNSGFINTGVQTFAGAKTFNNTLTAYQDVYLRGISVDNTKDSVLLIDGGRLLKKQLTGLAPIGTAGGDLSGNYPNPAIATGAVTGTKIAQAGATSGQVLKWNGTTWAPANDEGIGLSSQTANTVLAAPNGSNGVPAFRSLVPADMTVNFPGRLIGRYAGGAGPAQEISLDATVKMYPFGGTAYLYVDTTQLLFNASKIAGARVLSGGTAGQVLTFDGTRWAAATPAATGLTTVGLNGPSIFTTTNNPLTSNGAINITLTNQAANTVFAGPTTGAAAAPSFRALGSSDIQGVTTQRLLGRYTTGTGVAQEVALDNTLKLNTTGTLYADSALAVWNASKLQGVRVAATAPTDQYVLRYNAATSSWAPSAETAASNWLMTGNSNSTATSFLGTTVDQPMVLKYNNKELFRGTKGVGAYYDTKVVTLFNGATAYNAHPLVIRANGVDVLAFQDSLGTIKWHWNMMSTGLNFVESNVADYRLFLRTGGNVGVNTSTPNSTLEVNGSFAMPVRVAGNGNQTYTMTANDYTYIKNGTGNTTVTLPDASNCEGRIYVVKRANVNGSLTINATNSTIDGGANTTIATNTKLSYTFQAASGNWFIISGL